MPYTMVHLIVADSFAKKHNVIDKHEKLFLGAISPDAVHTKKNYNSEYKARSHFCKAEDTWGKIRDCNAWLDNVYKMSLRYKEKVNNDFSIGYLIHIITDIYYDIYVTQQYREKYLNFKLCAKGYKTLDLKQLNNDIALFNAYPRSRFLYKCLEKCEIENFLELVSKEDVKLYKNIVIRRYQEQSFATVYNEEKYIHITNEMNINFMKEHMMEIFKKAKEIIGYS